MAKCKETPTGEKEQQGRGGGDRGSTAARPTLTRDWGGPQVRDPTPIVSVNPEADPPQPRAPVRPNRAEQDGETAEEKSQSAICGSSGGNGARVKERRQRAFIQEGNRAPVSKAKKKWNAERASDPYVPSTFSTNVDYAG